ncbi:MAG: nodulation protein NfeD [Armatimonadota bacterium]
MRRFCVVMLTCLLGLPAVVCADGLVVQLSITSDINPATVSYVTRGIEEATNRSADMLLIELDTPGGQLNSTKDITSAIMQSPVPVAVWVGPDGARAASAGTFITYSAHIASMAPSTRIGAAHPVMMGSGMPGQSEQPDPEQMKTMEKKVVNDAVAFIRSLAEKRGRNAEWGEKAVTESLTATASEAAQKNIIDFIAATPRDCAEMADGRTVNVPSGEVTLQTADATFHHVGETWRENLLSMIAHPNVAYLLMIIGIYGIIFELKAPGFGGAGAVGIICLILGLYGLSVLPFSWAGLGLIFAGVALLVAELYTPTHGVLGMAGLIAFIIGSLLLVETPTAPISRPLIAGVGVGTAAFFFFALGAIIKGQKRPVTIGREALAGRTGDALEPLDPEGMVRIEGERWIAVAEEDSINEGERIVVIEEIDDMKLKVKRAE